MLDCGGFELRNAVYRKPWDYEQYLDFAVHINVTVIASFDHPDLTLNDHIDIYLDFKDELHETNKIIEFILSDLSQFQTLSQSIDRLIDLFETTKVDIIGIPDRYLTKFSSQPDVDLIKLSKIIGKYSPKTKIHLLGCGNPKMTYNYTSSISSHLIPQLKYFDSTSWYRYFFDLDTYSLQQLETGINCICNICTKYSEFSPYDRILTHNLSHYYKLIELSI